MLPNPLFLKQPKDFWADVRLISQEVGYTDRKTSQIMIPSFDRIRAKYTALGLHVDHIMDGMNESTERGQLLLSYFTHRAEVLNTYVEPRLMDASRARQVYEELASRYPTSTVALATNKQAGDKKTINYLTAIVNLVVEAELQGLACDFAPGSLTIMARDGRPYRTLARRVDGAFPGPVNPIAIWEIKEYYYTTTFGSRVADGVYETLLDGLELEELNEHEHFNVKHYLMVDAHYTWWKMGRSYLCRMFDMLHMGYVDEVLYGYEVVERLPGIVKAWVAEQVRRTD